MVYLSMVGRRRRNGLSCYEHGAVRSDRDFSVAVLYRILNEGRATEAMSG